jgi:uncharacterized membrane protein
MDNNEPNSPESNQQEMEPIVEESVKPRLRHSGLGIASFIVAILAIILTIVLSTMIANIASNIDITNFDVEDQTVFQQQLEEILEDNPELPIIFMLFFLIGGLALVGGILGIIGIFIKQRKKLFAILGTILNFLGIPVILIIALAIAFS